MWLNYSFHEYIYVESLYHLDAHLTQILMAVSFFSVYYSGTTIIPKEVLSSGLQITSLEVTMGFLGLNACI